MRKRTNPHRRYDEGTTAIEIAMIAPIFIALVFSTLEVGNVFFRQSVVEQAAHTAARQVRVGKAIASTYVNETPDEGECATGRECFWDDVCKLVEMFGDCAEHLSIEVQQFASFADLIANDTVMQCPNSPGYTFDAQPYEPGGANDVIRVRICYLIKTFNPAMGIKLGDNPDGTRSIIAVAIHRNEPYLDDEAINPNENLGS